MRYLQKTHTEKQCKKECIPNEQYQDFFGFLLTGTTLKSKKIAEHCDPSNTILIKWIRQVLPTLLYVDAAGGKWKKRAHTDYYCVTYVDVDTVATAQGNIVTISAPPFPSGKGVGGWGPLKTTAAWF